MTVIAAPRKHYDFLAPMAFFVVFQKDSVADFFSQSPVALLHVSKTSVVVRQTVTEPCPEDTRRCVPPVEGAAVPRMWVMTSVIRQATQVR